MLNPRIAPLLGLMVWIAGCSPQESQVHLRPAETQAFAAKTVAVLYVEPVRPLGAGLSIPPGGEIPGYHKYKTFLAQLDPYQPQAQKLAVQDRAYASISGMMAEVPWLKAAAWTRIQDPSEFPESSNLGLETAQATPADVIVVVYSDLVVHSYVDQISAALLVKVYVKPSPASPRATQYKAAFVHGNGDLGNPGIHHGFGFRDDSLPLAPEEVHTRLDKVFAQGGAALLGGENGALDDLRPQLLYLLTGQGEPPPLPASN